MEQDIRTDGLLALARELECRVVYDEPLSNYTTFKTGGPCYAMIDPGSEDRLARLIGEANNSGVRHLVMGKGSNILFDDRGYNGVIFLMGQSVDEIRMLDDTTIYAQAGCSLIKLCRFALEHNLTGLEFAYGIPGTVGGAIYMNAGAYGSEMKDIVETVEYLDEDCNLCTIENKDLEFGYRHSIFSGKPYVITSVTIALSEGEPDKIKAAMSECMAKRSSKQPLEYPSAGSTFKRPEGSYASLLIDQCGLKGLTCGGAMVSEKHSGFVINKGYATCSDVMELCDKIINTVKEKTGYELELEPVILK